MGTSYLVQEMVTWRHRSISRLTPLFTKYAREVAKLLPSDKSDSPRGAEDAQRVYGLSVGADFRFWHLADVGVLVNVRFAPIVLKKSFLGDERNFLGPLMRFARGDVRDHIVSQKNSHRPSYRR
jgi:hypothetical protein